MWVLDMEVEKVAKFLSNASGATCVSRKFVHQVAPHAQSHCWGFLYWHHQLVLVLYLHQSESQAFNQGQQLGSSTRVFNQGHQIGSSTRVINQGHQLGSSTRVSLVAQLNYSCQQTEQGNLLGFHQLVFISQFFTTLTTLTVFTRSSQGFKKGVVVSDRATQ